MLGAERDRGDEQHEDRRRPARDGVRERVVRAAVRRGQQREVGELERGRRGDERPRLRLDAPGQRGRDGEHDHAGEHRHGRRRVRVLRARDQRVPAGVEHGRGEDACARAASARARHATSSANRAAVDVPARDRHADAQALRLHLAGQQRGERAGAARLGDDLRALEQQPHRGDDLRVGDGDDLVDELLDDRERQLARDVGLLAVGDRPRDLDRDPLAGGERAHEVVARLGLDADDPRVRATARRSRSRSRTAARRRRGRPAARPAGPRPRSAPAPRCPARPSRTGCRTDGSA